MYYESMKKYCIICKKEILKGKRSKKQFEIQKYCSRKCFADDKRIVETVTCYRCKKTVIRKKRSDSKSKYCSVRCAAKDSVKIATEKRNYKGKNNPAYKNGKTKLNTGYIRLNTKGNKTEHRYLMEKHLGRKLTKTEVVHHINNNPEDNNIENLYLCKNQSEHMKIHRNGLETLEQIQKYLATPQV